MKRDEELQRAEDHANFLLSKICFTSEASAIEHLAGAVLLAAVILARRSDGDSQP